MHVYARISGHGVALVPRAPFLIRRTEGGVFLRHDDLSATVIIPEGGGMRYRLGEGVQGLRAVVDPVDVDYHGPFRIETRAFVCAWPADFALASPDRDGPFMFDLVGEGPATGALMFMAGPYDAELCPAIDALCGDTQQEIARGVTAAAAGDDVECIEVGYSHAGQPWRQLHHRFVQPNGEVLVLTAQARAAAFDPVRAAGAAVAASLQFA